MFQTATSSLSAGKSGQDRLAIIERGDDRLLVVADGAGGVSGGAGAAELAVELIGRLAGQMDNWLSGPAWCEQLRKIDVALRDDPKSGETDLVVAAVTPNGIAGASVGDSGAWLISSDRQDVLTARRRRKPLLGSGSAVPTSFEDDPLEGTLLLATDGLLKYVPRERFIQVAQSADLCAAAADLAGLPRLPSGALPDDVAVILCRAG